MEPLNRIDADKGELKAKLEAVVGKAKEVCKRLQDQTAAAAKATDKTIRQHPYETLGIAFGLGVLIGALVSRRRRD